MKSRKISFSAIIIAALSSILLLAAAAFADQAAADGRAICSKWGDAIVRVQIVLKTTSSYDGESSNREYKTEVAGTVVDPSGLTVVSKSDIDSESSDGEEDGEYQQTSQITDARIVLANGKEIPAKVVLRDKDLDLAFLRPIQKQAAPLAYVDLKDSVKADILDQVLIVTRLGKVADRALSACFEQIEAVIEKPRKVYSVSLTSVGSEYGSPVFAMNGKLVGIVLTKEMPSSGSSSYYDDSSMPIILPAEDILAVAEQAPEDAPKTADNPPAVEEKK